MSASLRGPFRGIVPPLVTPLAAQDQIDHDGLQRVVEHVIRGGVQGLFVLGTTGEAPSLSYEMRIELLSAVSTLAKGRIPIMAGISDTSYRETVRMGYKAADAGAWAAVVAPPFYFNYSQADLWAYIQRLAAELPIPFFIYNIPQLTKVAFEFDTVRRAIQLPSVLGLKDSSGDIEYLGRVASAAQGRPDFSVLIGPEEKLVQGMRAGAHGGVCGGANLSPSLFAELYSAAHEGRWSHAEELQAYVQELSSALYTVGDPQSSYLRGLKAALEISGICPSLPALPFQPFATEERKIIEERFGVMTAKR